MAAKDSAGLQEFPQASFAVSFQGADGRADCASGEQSRWSSVSGTERGRPVSESSEVHRKTPHSGGLSGNHGNHAGSVTGLLYVA